MTEQITSFDQLASLMKQEFEQAEKRTDEKFNQVEKNIDAKFALAEERTDERFALAEKRTDERFALAEKRNDEKFAVADQRTDDKIGELATMIQQGFEDVENRLSLIDGTLKLHSSELEQIKLELTHTAQNFEVKALEKRVGALEARV